MTAISGEVDLTNVVYGGVLDAKRRDWLALLGKGPGFVLFAFCCAAALFVLTAYGIDVTPLTGPLGVLCAGLYGGGAWKAAAEAKNGSKPVV